MTKNKTLSIKEYPDEINPYLKDINNLKISDTWKIPLTRAINFISSTADKKECVMHLKSDHIKIRIDNETDETINDLSVSFLSRFQIGLEELMKGSDFIFHYVDLCL